MRVLVTGATGFIGRRLIERLIRDSRIQVRAAVRRVDLRLPYEVEQVLVADVSPTTNWTYSTNAVDVVIHLAAHVHIVRAAAGDAAKFQYVNVGGTANVARQAASRGVARMVYLSSIKVNGEVGRVTEADVPRPTGAYGRSKLEAEEAVRRVCAETGMEAVIIRPPLVYGPGVKANFRSLMRAVARGIPLPLGAVHNRRSLIAVDNLVDFIVLCCEHPAAADQTFLVSDDHDLSTTDLVRGIARAMKCRPRLFPVPAFLLRGAARAVGRNDIAQRLLGSLELDISKARTVLGWSPPVSVDEALRRTRSDVTNGF